MTNRTPSFEEAMKERNKTLFKPFDSRTKTLDYEDRISLRIKHSDIVRINKIIANDPDETWANASHFIRSSIRRMLKSFEGVENDPDMESIINKKGIISRYKAK